MVFSPTSIIVQKKGIHATFPFALNVEYDHLFIKFF
jgi:hypothetical protein